MSTHPEPIATDLEGELTTRRTVTVAAHALFIDSLLTPEDLDEIDRELDEQTIVDPYECHAPSRRSDREVANLLDLLDNLETGNDRKETTR
jgi:hypothetical protein